VRRGLEQFDGSKEQAQGFVASERRGDDGKVERPQNWALMLFFCRRMVRWCSTPRTEC
jgi:hypothetical protein